VAVRRLPGASSTAVHAVGLADGRRLVVRRYVWPGFLESEPEAPGREVDALAFAGAHGLPVPDLVAADPTAAEVGDGIPVLLMTLLPGRATATPDLHRLAEVAAAVHDVDPTGFGHDWFPWYGDTVDQPPPLSTRPALWKRAIDLWKAGPPPFRPTFIHRDLHPGNVLWARGRATGIVDWANACRGPAGCDVAHCRANLLALSGPEAADRFVAAYEGLTGEAFDPWWEMASVLEHGPSHWTPAWLAASEPRLEAALRTLP
jgi:aminoglycoside phosphotransferase (APT) family kinase protein